MRIVIERGIRNMSFEIEVYDNKQEIDELISSHHYFHDGEIVGIEYNSQKKYAHISLSYDERNYWFEMEEVSTFELSMDTTQIYISEVIREEITDGISVDFGACGLYIEARKMHIRRLHK